MLPPYHRGGDTCYAHIMAIFKQHPDEMEQEGNATMNGVGSGYISISELHSGFSDPHEAAVEIESALEAIGVSAAIGYWPTDGTE